MPESASIGSGDENGPSLIDNVTELQQRGFIVYGKADNVYFSIDLPKQSVQKFANADALKKSLRTDNLDLVETERFYRDRKWEVSGVLLIVVGISAVMIAGAITFLFGRLVLLGISPKRNL